MNQKTDQPLRILHSEAAVAFGGQEHRIFKEMLAMRVRGHHMELVCRPEAILGDRLQAEGFAVHRVAMGGIPNFVRGVAAIRRILRQGQFDVLNTHSRKDTLIAALAGRLAGTPLIVRTRHLASPIGSLLSYTWLPHKIVTVSNHVRSMVLDKGVDAARVRTIYSPVAEPVPVAHSTLRDELGLRAEDTVLICVAVMREKKGHLFLLETLKPLFAKYPGLHLVCVGSGSPTFENVDSFIQKNGLERQAHLMGYRKDIPNLLYGSDVFVLATEQEASGTVYVEAQMCGLPVIGTDVGGVSEMFIPEETGFLVESKNRVELASALERLVSSEPLRKQMGLAAVNWLQVEGRFSLDRLVKDTESAYHQWLQEKAEK
ncbi:MAG: glycosyltransferase family 4 protein [Corticimicrobacter sp.]|uniref:glycosyltransferase family 4 protein n=1 Tax=Corticimicrobacter sp. TaxID=2678536 RepID=UPI0032DB55B0